MEPQDLEKKTLFNLISRQPGIDKIYLCAIDPYETKYQFLINKREQTCLKHFNDFIEYLNDMGDIYENIEEYDPNKKRKILIIFDVIADMLSNEKT